MPRKALIKTAEFPYHVWNRSNNRDFFYLPVEELWPIFITNLHQIIELYGCEIHGFVLMGNHYHLLISTPKENLGEAMKYFHREVARMANRRAGRINHFFGTRYSWSLIGHENYYWNVVKYVFRNPVRAGICGRVENYKYSSLNQQAQGFTWKMVDFFYERDNSIILDLDWLNEPFLSEHEQAIRKGLRRKNFELPKNSNGKLIELFAMHPKKETVT